MKVNLTTYYHISHWSPEIRMNGCGFSVDLFPAWKELVEKSEINQQKVNNIIENMKPIWVKGHPQSCNEFYPRVTWGEWGPEHITVEGNACGLDIGMCHGLGEKTLGPHNVDSLQQASLLLTVFLKIADYMLYEEWSRQSKQKK